MNVKQKEEEITVHSEDSRGSHNSRRFLLGLEA